MLQTSQIFLFVSVVVIINFSLAPAMKVTLQTQQTKLQQLHAGFHKTDVASYISIQTPTPHSPLRVGAPRFINSWFREFCLQLTIIEDSRPGGDVQIQGRTKGEGPQLWQPGKEHQERQQEQKRLARSLVLHVPGSEHCSFRSSQFVVHSQSICEVCIFRSSSKWKRCLILHLRTEMKNGASIHGAWVQRSIKNWMNICSSTPPQGKASY